VRKLRQPADLRQPWSEPTASMGIRVQLAVCIHTGPWTSPSQSFRIDVPCDNSCDNSWPIGGNHGESRSVTGADVSRPETQTRRSQAYDLRFLWWPGAGSNRRPSDFQAEIARPERSSFAESVLRQMDFVLCRSAIRELVLANPLANYSPAALRPSHRISVHCRCGLLHYSCRCRRRESSTSAMTCAGTLPRTGPMRSTVTERTCSA
jgi:hypothetical protein